GLALARRRGCDGGDENELPVWPAFQALDEFQRELGLRGPVAIEMLIGNADALCNLADRQRFGRPGDLDVTAHLLRHGRKLPCPIGPFLGSKTLASALATVGRGRRRKSPMGDKI